MTYEEPYYNVTGTARGFDLYGIYIPAVQINIDSFITITVRAVQTVLTDAETLSSESAVDAAGIRVKHAAASISVVSDVDRAVIDSFNGVQIDVSADISVTFIATRSLIEAISPASDVTTLGTEILFALIDINAQSLVSIDAKKLDTALIELSSQSGVIVYADDFDGVNAFVTIGGISRVLISDPLRLSESIDEDFGLIRTLISLNGRPITAQSRKFDESLEIQFVGADNWKGRTSRYRKKKSTRKSINLSWDFIPGQKSHTVDVKESRDYLVSLATKKSTIVVGIYNLDSDGLTAPTVDQAEYFITNYSEDIVRRDIGNNIYFWRCSMSLVEA